MQKISYHKRNGVSVLFGVIDRKNAEAVTKAFAKAETVILSDALTPAALPGGI